MNAPCGCPRDTGFNVLHTQDCPYRQSQNTQPTTPDLPPLPDNPIDTALVWPDRKPYKLVGRFYTANQMRDYALAAVKQYRKSLVPVAWKDTMHSTDEVGHKSSEPVLLGYEGWESIPDATDLYRLDDQP